MASSDGVGRILGVALALCIVCSVVVSTAAVILKPAQEANKDLDRKRNILQAAGMLEEGRSVEEQFAIVQERFVDLETGQFADDVAPDYDQREAANDPDLSTEVPSDEDIAKIGRRAAIAQIYLVQGGSGDIDKIILPVRGYGLWSTLHGFLALEADANTVAGLGFYEHGETPGLGGEVDNPRWKALWPGKKVYRDGEVELSLVKGSVDRSSAQADWKVDGLSGATLTSRGVTNLISYWMGDRGFAPFLQNLRKGEA